MKFSQRIGKKDVRQSFQIESIDKVLENKLWNNILTDFIEKINNHVNYGETDLVIFSKLIWEDFFEKKIDEIPSYYTGSVNTSGVIEYIKNWFISSDWFEKYDLIEFLSKVDNKVNFDFTEKINVTLKKEVAGYTIINSQITQITSEQEIRTIEDAIQNTSNFSSVEIHINRALELLSNRENPDYRNSIKESISAVEAYCVILTGDAKATLGQALKKLQTSINIHPALQKSFSNLYGYTSEANGIRHALLAEDNLEQEDAKFMLVSCSSFINYLIEKQTKSFL